MAAYTYRVRIKGTPDTDFVIGGGSAENARAEVASIAEIGDHGVLDWENADYAVGDYEVVGEPVEVPDYPAEDVDILTEEGAAADELAAATTQATQDASTSRTVLTAEQHEQLRLIREEIAQLAHEVFYTADEDVDTIEEQSRYWAVVDWLEMAEARLEKAASVLALDEAGDGLPEDGAAEAEAEVTAEAGE
jgi:hypothetical protein